MTRNAESSKRRSPKVRAIGLVVLLALGGLVLVVGSAEAGQTASYCQMHKCYGGGGGGYSHCHGHPDQGWNYYCHTHYYNQ